MRIYQLYHIYLSVFGKTTRYEKLVLGLSPLTGSLSTQPLAESRPVPLDLRWACVQTRPSESPLNDKATLEVQMVPKSGEESG